VSVTKQTSGILNVCLVTELQVQHISCASCCWRAVSTGPHRRLAVESALGFIVRYRTTGLQGQSAQTQYRLVELVSGIEATMHGCGCEVFQFFIVGALSVLHSVRGGCCLSQYTAHAVMVSLRVINQCDVTQACTSQPSVTFLNTCNMSIASLCMTTQHNTAMLTTCLHALASESTRPVVSCYQHITCMKVATCGTCQQHD
jgi:hypothetical protein